MTFKVRQALDAVIRDSNFMPQSDVLPADRPAFLELLRLGLIEEKWGSYSGRPYWTTTTAGRARWGQLHDGGAV